MQGHEPLGRRDMGTEHQTLPCPRPRGGWMSWQPLPWLLVPAWHW